MKKIHTFIFLIPFIFNFNTASAQWQSLSGPYGDNTYLPVFFDSIYYTSSYQGLIASTDSGNTWAAANVSFYEKSMSTLYFNEGKLIYDRLYNTLGWISLDSGSTWTQMASVGSFYPYEYQISNGVIYALCEYEFMYKSSDNGLTWTSMNHPPTSNAINDFIVNNGRIYWAVTSNGTGIGNVYYSDNDGILWQTLPTNGITVPTSFYQIIANNNQLFVSCSDGVYKSIDGGNNWSLFDTGLPANYYYFYHYTRIYQAKNKIYAYVHNDGGLFSSDTLAPGFINISNGLPYEVYVSGVTENNNTLYFSSPTGLFATDKTIINWHLSESGIHIKGCSSLGAVDSSLFAGGYYSMHVSHDNGDSFVSLPVGEATSDIYVKNNVVYSISARGYKSTDGGFTWSSLNFPYGFFGQNLIDFCTLNNYYFGLNAGDHAVKFSIDSGANWNAVNGLPANSVNCLGSSNSKIFAGTNSGIYKSSNYGATWTTSLSGNNITKILDDNGNIYALSAGNKIWVSPDNGNTWQDMNYPGSAPDAMTVNNNTVVVSPGLYYTSDFGTIWNFLAAPALTFQTGPNVLLLTDSYLFAGYTDSIFKLSSTFLTGINEMNNLENNILISPNPVTNYLTITTGNNEQSEILIYDMASRKLLGKSFFNTVTLNTEQLAKSIYLYEVRNKNGVIKKGKVVKD